MWVLLLSSTMFSFCKYAQKLQLDFASHISPVKSAAPLAVHTGTRSRLSTSQSIPQPEGMPTPEQEFRGCSWVGPYIPFCPHFQLLLPIPNRPVALNFPLPQNNTSFVHSFNKDKVPVTCQALLKAVGYNFSE